MNLTIRQARSHEWEAVGELTARAYIEDGVLESGERDPYLSTLRDAEGRATQAVLLVAARAAAVGAAAVGAADAGGTTVRSGGPPSPGELLGSVAFVTADSPYAELAGPGEAEFRMLAVDPGARGEGVGEALVHACLDRAAGLGLERLVLCSHPRMAVAHRLYGRLGFERIPERDWEPLPGLSLLAYAREFAPPHSARA